MADTKVDFMSEADQKKWLKQRGWLPDPSGRIFTDPDTGIPMGFIGALDKAKKQTKFPADFELKP